jgi:hypothetical protein
MIDLAEIAKAAVDGFRSVGPTPDLHHRAKLRIVETRTQSPSDGTEARVLARQAGDSLARYLSEHDDVTVPPIAAMTYAPHVECADIAISGEVALRVLRYYDLPVDRERLLFAVFLAERKDADGKP